MIPQTDIWYWSMVEKADRWEGYAQLCIATSPQKSRLSARNLTRLGGNASMNLGVFGHHVSAGFSINCLIWGIIGTGSK
jgi:hypothetical protein